MRWTERQRAMLSAMGVELFERAPARHTEVQAGAPAAVVEAPAKPEASASAEVAVAASPGGTAEADWLIVGEPIDDETDPTGAQAQLLDNMLRAIGVSRRAAGRSGRAVFLAFADKPDAASAGDTVAPLRSALAAVQPLCAIALGRAAAQALLGTDEPLGALRGRPHRSGGVPVVARCSLAVLVRHPGEKARAWADLCLAVGAADAVAAASAP